MTVRQRERLMKSTPLGRLHAKLVWRAMAIDWHVRPSATGPR